MSVTLGYPETEQKKTGDGGMKGAKERVCRGRGGLCCWPPKDQQSLNRSESKTNGPSLYTMLQHVGCVGIVGLRKPSMNSSDLQWLLVVSFLVRPYASLCLNSWMSLTIRWMGSRRNSEGKYHESLHTSMKDIIITGSSYWIQNSRHLQGFLFIPINSTEQLKAIVHWIPVSMSWVLTNNTFYKQS